MNRIEEKLYTEIILDCEGHKCGAIFTPDTDACDPMTEWAKRNAAIALEQGWHSTSSDKTFCQNCVITEVNHLKIWAMSLIPFLLMVSVGDQLFVFNEALGRLLIVLAFIPLMYGVISENNAMQEANIDTDKGSKSGNVIAWILGFIFIGCLLWAISVLFIRYTAI